MPADRRVRQRAKYNHPAIGSKEHKKKWGLPKEVYPPFSTFTRDPRQYAKVPAGMLGEFLKQHYDYEKEKEMARETQKVRKFTSLEENKAEARFAGSLRPDKRSS